MNWEVGGGSVLAARWDPRESWDLDVFIDRSTFKRFQDTTVWETRLTRAANNMGARRPIHLAAAVKIPGVPLDDGRRLNIDIVGLLGEARVEGPTEQVSARGRPTDALGSGTILRSKLLSRNPAPRDVYDLAAGLQNADPGEAAQAVQAMQGLPEKLLKEWKRDVKAMEWDAVDIATELREPRWPEVARDAKRIVLEGMDETLQRERTDRSSAKVRGR